MAIPPSWPWPAISATTSPGDGPKAVGAVPGTVRPPPVPLPLDAAALPVSAVFRVPRAPEAGAVPATLVPSAAPPCGA